MRSDRGTGAVVFACGPDRQVKGPAGRRREVLIEIDGGIEEVLSAEPAIRSLQQTGGDKFNITVCAGDEALFRNHPGVREILNPRWRHGGRHFDMCWRLGPDALREGDDLLVDAYARRLGVELVDRQPRVFLDSYDMVRMQRFGAWRAEGKRIVVSAGTADSNKAWDEDKWAALCDYLTGKLGATLIQVGRRGERFFGYGRNLVGKLTSREVATVLKSSDLFIGVDNGWQHLAGAVGRPSVLLTSVATDTHAMERKGCLAISAGGAGVQGMVRDITIEAVLKGVARVHDHEHFEGCERAVCA